MTLPSLAIRRPITTLMAICTVLGLGIISLQRIPLEFLPPLELPLIFVSIPYVGATPEQVQNEVAIPAEGEFRTIPNLQRISSTSDQNGCNIQLEFKLGTDMTQSTAEVRDRIERLKLDLPAEIERMLIQKFSSDTLPIMVFGLYWDGDEDELAYLCRTVIQPRLMRLEGVADCQILGRPEREILIEFDQEALRNRHLDLYQVVNSLQAANLNVSVGQMTEGDKRYFVRALDEIRTPEALGELIVGQGNTRLNEVADVGFRTREVSQEFGIDGRSGTFIFIRKEAMANAVATCQVVEEELKLIAVDPMFDGLKQFMIFNQSDSILSALDGLIDSGRYGAVLAVAVLFLFLARTRPTIIVGLAIPLSVLISFVFMYFTGMSLNLITMISLIIALGMLVDNSIVVIENIFRYVELGHSYRESAERGANEVAMAITASTLTSVVVAIPVIFLESGPFAIYMRQFFGPIIVSTMASLLVALTLIPLAACHMKPKSDTWLFRIVVSRMRRVRSVENERPNILARLQKRALRLIMTSYVSALGSISRNRLASLLVLGVVLLTTIFPMLNLKRQRMPAVDVRRVDINVRLDQGVDMPRAHDIFDTIVKVIDIQRDELAIKNIFVNYNMTGGDVNIYLHDVDEMPGGGEPPFSTEQVMDILWQRLSGKVPGGELRFNIADAGEQTSRAITLQLRGDDAVQLDIYATELGKRLAALRDVSDVNTDTIRENQEVRLIINDTMASQFRVSPLSIAQTVDFALRGIRLQNMKYGNREVPVWAQFAEEDRKSRSNLENIDIGTGTGQLVSLSQLVEFRKAQSPRAIQRVNGKNVKTVSAKYTGDDLAGLVRDIQAIRNSFALAQGYTIEFGSELMELDTNMSDFFLMLLLAIVLIYAVMGASFESYLLPLSILMTVWMAGIGVIWSLYLSGTPVDAISFIGMILLAGVIVNNGIVIIDHINQLRLSGVERYEAILQAGRDRFRPVMMTALTTILGCVPLAIGGTFGGQVSFTSLGIALIGGLSAGTALTLLVVPLFYSIFDDGRIWFSRYFANVTSLFRAA
ncbi:MAG: acriflavin resistance protein [Candidatus Hydrogenedentota bacterium]